MPTATLSTWLVNQKAAALPVCPVPLVCEGGNTLSNGQGTGGNLSVAFEPGTRGVYLLGSDLAALPSGKVYEVWKIEGGTPVRGACFRPTANGSFFRFLDTDISTTQVMAVTVEPATCSSAPTSEPFLTATITQA